MLKTSQNNNLIGITLQNFYYHSIYIIIIPNKNIFIMTNVSVVISTYNRPKLLIKSINSILNQTYQDFEIIVIDDCSEKEIFKEISAYSDLDNRIMIYQTETNVGNNQAKNFGIKKSIGKYIAILDDDDIAIPKRLSSQINVFKRNEKIDVVGSQIKYITNNGLSIFSYPQKFITNKFPLPGDEVFEDIYLGKYNIPNSSLMIKKKSIEKFGYPNTRENGGDMTMILKIAAQQSWFFMISEPLVLYRKGSGHKQMTESPRKINIGRKFRNHSMKEWLSENQINSFDHLHQSAVKNTQTRYMLETAVHTKDFSKLAFCLWSNPFFTLYKFYQLIPQSLLKAFRNIFPDKNYRNI